VLNRPPKKPGGKEADEVGSTTTTSRASATTFGNTTQTITNRLENEKVTSIVLTIKEQEVFEEVLLGDIRHQIKGRSTEMADKDAETASLTVSAASSTWGGQVQTFPKVVRTTKFPALYGWIQMPKRRNLKLSKTCPPWPPKGN